MRFLITVSILFLILPIFSCKVLEKIESPKQQVEYLEFDLQQRDPETNKVIITKEKVAPQKIGIVVIDMWNDYICPTGTELFGSSLIPRMNRVFKAARALVVTAAVLNLVMAGLFWLTANLPADLTVGPQESFGRVLSPIWRIVFASIIAEVVSELVDTEGYRFWVERVTRKYQWARVLVSNSVSIPLDSLIFVWIAFGGTMPGVVVWSIFASNVIVKGLTTLVSLPGIYLVKEKP